MAGRWPLIGRMAELQQVAAVLTSGGGPRGVVLAGAAGVGKTRLAREALSRAEQRGAVGRWTSASRSARKLPLGAFAPLLGPNIGQGDPSQVLRHAADALVEGAGRGGVVVVVDDAHLLDDLSALLVHRLALHGTATVVLTVRTGEPAPEPVTASWKDDLLHRFEVQPLDASATAELLEAVLGGPVDSSAANDMWMLTQGNALFLRHLVEGEVGTGRLLEVRGVWRWAGRPVLSAGLAELVEDRMGAASAPVQEVVELLALAEPLDLPLLAGLTDPADIEQAEAAGLVTVEPATGGRLQVRLAHPLYGELQRVRLGGLRGRRLRGRVVTALAETAEGDAAGPDGLLRRAVLALDADLAADPCLLTAGAAAAVNLADLELGERLARAAVDAGGGFEARLQLGFTLSWLSLGVEADLVLTELAGRARDDTQRTLVAVPRAANLFWLRRDPAGAETVLRAAADVIADPDGRRELVALQAAFDGWLGRPQRAIDRATEAFAGGPLSDLTTLTASWGLVTGYGSLGRSAEIADAAQRGYAAVGAGALLRFGLSDQQIIALRLAGHLAEAERIADERHREATTAVGVTRLMGAALQGHAALARGRLRTSARWLREARAGLADDQMGEMGGWDFRCLLSLTQALAMAGDATGARAALDELEADAHPSFVFLAPEVGVARAWVAAAEGVVSEGVDRAHEAAAVARHLGQPASELVALHTALCFGDRRVADRLVDLAARLDGPRAPAVAAHATGWAAGDIDALLAASQQFEAIDDLVAATDAAAQAAALRARRGRGGRVHGAADRAHRLAAACEGAHTPALVAAARPLPLTAREREVVTLAAQGLTNRAIANRLVISMRTVEGHIHRAHSKLGTTDRHSFAALLPLGHDTAS